MNWEPTRVDGDDFAAALMDPEVREVSKESVEFVDRLRQEGRDHSVPFKHGVVTPVLFERTLPEPRWNPDRYALDPLRRR